MSKENYNPRDNQKISTVLDNMLMNPYRSGSFMDMNPDNPQDGKWLILNSLFCKKTEGVLHNVPLTANQVCTLMDTLQDQNIVCLDLTGNMFDDNALAAILSRLPNTVKTLTLTGNNFTQDSIRRLNAFNADHPECDISTDEYNYTYIQSDNAANDAAPDISTPAYTEESSTLGDSESM